MWAAGPVGLPPLNEVLDWMEAVFALPTGESRLDGGRDLWPEALATALDGGGDRTHRILHVEQLAQKFEAYGKKYLLFIEPTALAVIEQNRKGLEVVLRALGLDTSTIRDSPATLQGRTNFAEHLARAYQVRNKVHVAEDWTSRQLADGATSTAIAFLFVTATAFERLRAVVNGRRLAPRLRLLLERCQRTLNAAVELTAEHHGGQQAADPTEPWAIEDMWDRDLDELEGALDDEVVDTPSRVRVSQAVLSTPQLLLLGPPGAGKSTTLELLAGGAAKRRLETPGTDDPIPLLVQLSHISPERSLVTLLGEESGGHWPAGDALIRSSDWLVLLDGLNEAPPACIDQVIRDVERLVERQSLPRVVITSRDMDVVRRLRLSRWVVQPLDDEQVLSVLERSFKDSEAAASFAAVLNADQRLATWARNPLMLRMLAAMGARASYRLPRNRGRMFAEFIRWILDREYAKPGERTPRELTFRVLMDLGYNTRLTGRRSFSLDEYLSSARASGNALGRKLDLIAFLDEACGARILDRRRDDVSFAHELYQEYFAAEWLRAHAEAHPGLVESLVRDEHWREPIALLHGIIEDRKSLFTKVVSINVATAAACLVGDQDGREEEVASVVTHALRSGVEGSPAEQRDAVSALVSLRAWSATAQALVAAAEAPNARPGTFVASALLSAPEPADAALGILEHLDIRSGVARMLNALMLRQAAVVGFPVSAVSAQRARWLAASWKAHGQARPAAVLGLTLGVDSSAPASQRAEQVREALQISSVPTIVLRAWRLHKAQLGDLARSAVEAAIKSRRCGLAWEIVQAHSLEESYSALEIVVRALRGARRKGKQNATHLKGIASLIVAQDLPLEHVFVALLAEGDFSTVAAMGPPLSELVGERWPDALPLRLEGTHGAEYAAWRTRQRASSESTSPRVVNPPPSISSPTAVATLKRAIDAVARGDEGLAATILAELREFVPARVPKVCPNTWTFVSVAGLKGGLFLHQSVTGAPLSGIAGRVIGVRVSTSTRRDGSLALAVSEVEGGPPSAPSAGCAGPAREVGRAAIAEAATTPRRK